jgi:hypothetical protein
MPTVCLASALISTAGIALALGCASGGDGEWNAGNTGDDAGPVGIPIDAKSSADAPADNTGITGADGRTGTGGGSEAGTDVETGNESGTGDAEACSPSSCAGCCSQGACIATSTDMLCGVSGVACEDCTASGRTCNAGVCVSPTAPSDAGSTCATPYTHNDGLDSISSTFSDCVPTTVDSALAQDECLHNSSQCNQACPGADGGGPTAWCGSGFYGCFCWSYAGPAKGSVGSNSNCSCPTVGGNAYY